ncbi:hypothetical protein F8388_018835 [Cannabis sativa]|uniref:SAC domain-containing protein n=1 Tax=Cannabis sativa TaxID=3483 RepID=A0A7J6F6Q1_CANSA|nr:hypothetical protein F8388_018835 [Cannabis sativa]
MGCFNGDGRRWQHCSDEVVFRSATLLVYLYFSHCYVSLDSSYLKRGVNDRGRVANDVETEQIVLDEEAGSCKGKMSSVVQMRGSIPLFWSQEVSKFPKPDIILQRYDPTYQATKLHFEDLVERYGNPIIVLNLIKTVEKRPREMMLRREYANAVGYLNQILSQDNHVRFIHWDFHKFAKSKSANVLAVLGNVARQALDLTGFYYSGKPSIIKRRGNQLSRTSTARDASLRDLRASSGDLARFGSSNETLSSAVNQDRQADFGEHNRNDNFYSEAPCFQSGVLRTNCIDCLDRTNVAQYAYGLAALGRQLHAMGLTDMLKVDPDSTIAAALMDMYQSMGDALAQQYGGSEAHNTVFTERQGKWKATTQSREFLKSIKRYYSNTCTDGEKQDAMNLFLGYFKPQEGKPALWELDSDYYLHVSGIGDDLFPDRCLETNNKHVGAGFPLSPIPACREDFSQMKLTSFDKLIEKTCSSIKNVRLCREPNQRPGGGAGSYGVAPDAAAKIQGVSKLSRPWNILLGLKHRCRLCFPMVILQTLDTTRSIDVPRNLTKDATVCLITAVGVSTADVDIVVHTLSPYSQCCSTIFYLDHKIQVNKEHTHMGSKVVHVPHPLCPNIGSGVHLGPWCRVSVYKQIINRIPSRVGFSSEDTDFPISATTTAIPESPLDQSLCLVRSDDESRISSFKLEVSSFPKGRLDDAAIPLVPSQGLTRSCSSLLPLEIQLKSPNWLFGQRKYEENVSSPKVISGETNGESTDEKEVDCFRNQYWVSSGDNGNDEDIIHRYLAMSSVDEANGWYGGTLVGDQDESSEIYKHYAQLCEGPAVEPFQNDTEQEQQYADVLRMETMDIVEDAATEEEMGAALKEYDQIGADLGISPLSRRSFAGDPSWLTRWIVGEDQLERA